MGNFQLKNFDIFLIFAQNIDCGYTLEPPRLEPQFCYIKVGFKGVYIARTCFPDVYVQGNSDCQGGASSTSILWDFYTTLWLS